MYATNFVPTNILPKPFGNTARSVSPGPERSGAISVVVERRGRGGLVRVGDVNVGGIWWARFGLRRRITWMLGCLRGSGSGSGYF